MRPIDVRHLHTPSVICSWQVDDVLVDPGPESSVDTLLDALGDEQPRALLLTHIHFDHAGAAGALVREWPDVEVWVHERGARHLVDPTRLVASAKRLYGADFDRLWGEVVPIPERSLRVLHGGESLDGWDVAYTPGHASHHVSYRHRDSGWVFPGDTCGVRMPGGDLLLAPTPPPDIDLGAWRASLDAIEAWEPTTLAITHFGDYADVGEHLQRLREALSTWGQLARETDRESYAAALREAYAAALGPTGAVAFAQAMPADDQWLGLDRYWRRRPEAGEIRS
ncbi:MAG TPA: MBL fold metallo-hydrolase [Solirubrobacteraceae bacterium]|jgi:glyoxylase-like metal-dependent hydrolase (beta-lactamase superfamily II)|nr:MBL fold metallo-hydrolase [Solirubrobacteraceae bacterium]